MLFLQNVWINAVTCSSVVETTVGGKKVLLIIKTKKKQKC
jgi:hypothetical protein